MKRNIIIILTAFLSIGLTGISYAGYLDDWTDDQLCGWMDNPSPPEHIVAEINKRGLSCGVSNNASSSSTTTTNTSNTDTSVIGELAMDFELTSYDVEFSEKVSEELLSETLKTDFDFSKYKLVKNDRNLQCQFSINKVSYKDSVEGEIESWNRAEGYLEIDSGKVNIHANTSRWKTRGLSEDPTYLEDEVNLRLTEDGYLVGKMAYFDRSTDPGQPPVKPLYVELIKHKKSKPLNYNNPKKESAQLWIEVNDWSDGVLFLNDCKQTVRSILKTTSIEASDAFDGNYSFKISLSYADGLTINRIGNGYIEINNGIMTVAEEGRTLVSGSEDLYDSFEGRIDKKGNIISVLEIPYRCDVANMTLKNLDLRGNIKRQLKHKCENWGVDFEVVLKLGGKE